VMGHANAGAQEVAKEVAREAVASLAHAAATAAAALPASTQPLLAALSLADTPPFRDVLASKPQAACDLGATCVRLAGAAKVRGSGGDAALAAAATAAAGACMGHALAAARQGRLEWQRLAELLVALGPACSHSPGGTAPVLEAAAEVRAGGADESGGRVRVPVPRWRVWGWGGSTRRGMRCVRWCVLYVITLETRCVTHAQLPWLPL
jgi:hypothetical protein